ncbi:hypothetical protein CMV_014094 [Castanea mollissima]|uniref:EF-hand domain-containing protein n=1 Tax=Castanea mollissima TaxID=60419 RepID=A0A8J4R797_9ROSI|nr:hypothetical protein CMV_014094 [Castanea mollissima]
MIEYSQNIPQKQPSKLLNCLTATATYFPNSLFDMGRITFNAVTHYKPLPPTNEKQLRDTFQKYDRNGDGLLSRAELENAFKSLGSHMPNWRARRALNHADANGDKFISLEELDEVVKYAAKHGYVLEK